MDLIDVSRALAPGMTVYSSEEAFSRALTHSVSRDGYNLSLLKLGAHTGTHVDAPLHFIEGGPGIETMPLNLMMGEALLSVVHDGSAFEDVPEGTVRLILKSGRFSGLTPLQAAILIRKGVRLLGTDRLSVAPGDNEPEIHRLLMESGVWMVENLALEPLTPGRYEFYVFALLIPGSEAAPARAVCRRMDFA